MPVSAYAQLDRHLSMPARLGLAVLAVAVLATSRLSIETLVGVQLSPPLLYPFPVVIAAWFGGFWAGIVATVLAMMVIDFLYLEPRFSLGIENPRLAVELFLFALQGVAISLLGFARLKARRAANAAYNVMEDRVAQRTADLRTANDSLHQEITYHEQTQAALQAINRRLEQSNRELQDFASVASHDLQEPLRKIQAFSDRLFQRHGDELPESAKDYLERVRNAAGRMSVLINDLLTYSRVTTKARPFEDVDLNDVVAGVVSDLEAQIERSGGRVEIDPLPRIQADPLQMRQVFQNLISNALKFAAPGRAPVVRVHVCRNIEAEATIPGPAVTLCVTDNGIGFDEKYLDRIFNVFQRLHGRGEYEGTGIGLAVCRKIAQRHGGDITATSRPGEGSTFMVTLPTQHPQGSPHDSIFLT